MEIELQPETAELFTEEIIRTSENNMVCHVPYETMTAEEQAELEFILKVAN